MNLVQHISNNDVLAAPPGVNIERCKAAPITRLQYADGLFAVKTYWQPSPEELKKLNSGEFVVLECWGVTIPPVCISVEG